MLARVASRIPKFPEKLKGGRLERWKDYWFGVAGDYKEAIEEFSDNCRKSPIKSSIAASCLTFGVYASYHNPDERSFQLNFMDNGIDIAMVSALTRNKGCESLQDYVSRGYNAGLLKRTDLGVCSLMWVDDYNEELASSAARCEYLKPGWLDMRYRVIDVGFLDTWWISARKMKEFDVNSDEWDEEGRPRNADQQLKHMW